MCVSEEELYQNYQEKALHNDSDEDADSSEDQPDRGIVLQYRPIRISWSQLSVVRHNTASVLLLIYRSLSFSTSSTQTNIQYVLTAVAVESWYASALKNAVISSLATVHPHPPTVAAILTLFIRECRSISSRVGWEGREANSQPEPQKVLQALLGLMPVCWQTLHNHQTVNVYKILLLQSSVMALYYII